MNKYLKFEYWNTCDLGNIYYQGGQHFWFYLDGDVLEPFHEETEDGQENGEGDFIPTFRRGMKRYRIRTGLVPDYMVDAIQRMKLHDHIELTFKTGEIEQIYNVDVEMEWQFEKYCHQATVVLTFDMDEKIVVGSCCDNLTVSTGEEEPEEVIPEIYWIATNGDDNSGDGTYTKPWKTLAYAASQATVSGDIIHVKAGTYYETQQTVLAAGVSILGAGDTSVITATTALSPMISMLSLTEGVNGNQSISYIKLDGDLTAQQALYSRGRSNIKLHHVTIVDFLGTDRNVVRIDGRVSGAGEPTTWATGIEIYDCAFTNNGADFVYSAGIYFAWAALEVMGTQGILIHDNVFNNQTGGRYGYCLKCINGYIRGAKIYDNEFYTNVRDQNGVTSYSFCIELWNGKGGVDIYDNYCNGGGIDLAGRGWEDPYSYGYAARGHHNTLILNAQPTYRSTAALLLESGSDDGVYFYKNYVKNFTQGVTFSMRNDADAFVVNIDGFYIYYNIFENLGKNNSTQAGYGITNSIVNVTKDTGSEVTFDATVNDFVVANNVIYHSVLTAFGLYLTATDSVSGHGATWTNVLVVNNIFGIMYWPCQWKDQTLDYVTVKENIFHDAEDTTMFNNCTVTNDDVEAGVDDNPDFIGGAPFNFHLQAGSPAINAGVATGQAFITTDYDDEAIANPPEIGAYEF